MARSDYWVCDLCREKAFYDADLLYEGDWRLNRNGNPLPVGAGDMVCICVECAKTHKVLAMKKDE